MMKKSKRGNNVYEIKKGVIIESGAYIYAEGQRVRLNKLESIILDRLGKGPITVHDAISELGVTSLPSRIHDLRNKNVCIDTRRVVVISRYGAKCYVAEYSLCTEGD